MACAVCNVVVPQDEGMCLCRHCERTTRTHPSLQAEVDAVMAGDAVNRMMELSKRSNALLSAEKCDFPCDLCNNPDKYAD